MGRVGRAAACLDSTQKTSEEWCENRCDKRGWTFITRECDFLRVLLLPNIADIQLCYKQMLNNVENLH